jgi:molybdopterin molybdotransferase
MPTFGTKPPPPIEVEEAQRIVLGAVEVLGSEESGLLDALGRVLREDIVAPRDVPFADNSGMDGYAVRAADLRGASRAAPVVLTVIEDVPAGRVPERELAQGTATRIMTGAVIPPGADSVVQVELTDGGAESVAVFEEPRAGANVRRAGEDMREGETVLRGGARIGAAELAVLASVQRPRVRVGKRPHVSIVATGDELVDPSEPFRRGAVVNSNAWALAALTTDAGGIPEIRPPARDEREATVESIRSALGADFIVSTGGVSVGAYDVVHEALEELGAETLFWQVSMKPGKPVAFARIGRTLYFGLPGNPVSCMVGFLLFAAPALRRAAGEEKDLLGAEVRAVLTGSVRGTSKRRTYARVHVAARGGRLEASPAEAQGSGMTTSMVGANGLAVLAPGADGRAGEEATVLLIGPLTAG